MQNIIAREEEYILISRDTPLISNLNMIENIALIKEVHERMPTVKAQELALTILETLDIAHVARQRITNCNSVEIFYILIVRAFMMTAKTIIIQAPYSIVNNLGDIKTILSKIREIIDDKKILIIDIITNESHYEGCSCNIVK